MIDSINGADVSVVGNKILFTMEHSHGVSAADRVGAVEELQPEPSEGYAPLSVTPSFTSASAGALPFRCGVARNAVRSRVRRLIAVYPTSVPLFSAVRIDDNTLLMGTPLTPVTVTLGGRFNVLTTAARPAAASGQWK